MASKKNSIIKTFLLLIGIWVAGMFVWYILANLQYSLTDEKWRWIQITGIIWIGYTLSQILDRVTDILNEIVDSKVEKYKELEH